MENVCGRTEGIYADLSPSHCPAPISCALQVVGSKAPICFLFLHSPPHFGRLETMSFDGDHAPMMATDKKRRMSLKGPPLRVAVKSTASTQEAPKPRTAIPHTNTVSAPQPRPSLASSSMSDRRLSISARAHAKASAPKPTVGTFEEGIFFLVTVWSPFSFGQF